MMNSSEELASISFNITKDLAKKFMDVIKEILKALILRGTRNKDNAKPGKNKIKKLLSDGHNLNAPIKIDQQDVKTFYKMAKQNHIPVAIIKGKNGHRAFFRECDVGRVSEMMKEMISLKLDGNDKSIDNENINNDNKLKSITIDKDDAKLFKNRAKSQDLSTTYFDTKDGNVKIAFQENDIDKVKAIINDVSKAKEKKFLRSLKIRFDKTNDYQKLVYFTRTPTLRVYDKELKSSVSMKLPITKNAFIKTVKSKFGYSDIEAQDLASRVEKGDYLGYKTTLMGTRNSESISWKPDLKEQAKLIEKLENNIAYEGDPDSLKNFSFSRMSLADSKNTTVLTIYDKENKKTYTTESLDEATFQKEIKEQLGVNDNVAKDMVDKAGKLGFISDYEKTIDKLNISRDKTTEEWIYSIGDKEYRSLNENKNTVINGLKETLSLNDKEAEVAWAKGMTFAKTYYQNKFKDKATFENYEISKSSNNNSVTFAYDGKTFRADLDKKDNTLSGLQKTFGLTQKEAEDLFVKAEKQGVKEVVNTANKKN